MALIRYAEGQQRSGSLGATVYSHNRFGQYVRARSVPVQPNTSLQNAVRVLMGVLVDAWMNELTTLQRYAWKAYADAVQVPNKFGDMVNLTALNMYVRSNLAALQGGLARVDDGPVTFNTGSPDPEFAVTASAATQLLSVTFQDGLDWCTEVGAGMLVAMGSPQSPSRTFFGGPWRFAASIDGAVVAPTSPQTLTAPFTVVEGQRIWVKHRIFRADGRLSGIGHVNFLGAA